MTGQEWEKSFRLWLKICDLQTMIRNLEKRAHWLAIEKKWEWL